MIRFLYRWSAVVFALGVFLVFAGCGEKSQPPVEEKPAGIGTDAETEKYNEALKKDPNNLQALIGLANIYCQTNRDRDAIPHLEKALELDPFNPNVRTDLAVSLRRTGKHDRAINELKKVISGNPRHYQSRYNLGVILIQDKKDVEGGIRAWEGILENIPDYPYRDQLKQEIERQRAASRRVLLEDKRLS